VVQFLKGNIPSFLGAPGTSWRFCFLVAQASDCALPGARRANGGQFSANVFRIRTYQDSPVSPLESALLKRRT
jgi:hypothetical protein